VPCSDENVAMVSPVIVVGYQIADTYDPIGNDI